MLPVEEVAKLGIGLASFGALLRFLWWLAGELKESRKDFLVGLDKRDANLAAVMHLEREHNERQTARLHEAIATEARETREAIDDLGAELRHHSNGRSKG